MIEKLISYHTIISDQSLVDKSTLILTNNKMKDMLNPVSYSFCNDVHNDIIEGYESEISGFGGVFIYFRNEFNKSVVKSIGVLMIVKNV